jgi:hypothetical protein
VAKAGDILVSQTGARYKGDYGNFVLLDSDDWTYGDRLRNGLKSRGSD